ncbi:MAG: hypothetical protein QXP77_00955 [Candidatus Aenigmatarchaeota archaeon]
MKFLLKIALTFTFLLILGFFIKSSKNEVGMEFEGEIENQIEIFINKESYREGEEIYINVSFFSSGNLKNAEVKLEGIKSRFGNYLSLSKTIDLKKGKNVIEFYYRAPYCNVCTGVNPGEHEITAQVIYNNATLASASKNIIIGS